MALHFSHEAIDPTLTENVSSQLYEELWRINPELWTPTYGQYGRDIQKVRLSMIASRLNPIYAEDPKYINALHTTFEFVDNIFDTFEGKTDITQQGSFAFIVPSRIERKSAGDIDDYGPEANQHMPLLEYVDSATRQVFMAGQCPFIIDQYGMDKDGKRGYMVYAPLLGDITRDITDAGQLLSTVDEVINDTTDFAKKRLGVEVVGLGAILPRLTNMGRAIRTPDLITTTGHGGTVALILRTLEKGYDQGLTRDGLLRRIGIIGSGAIGAATADVILSENLTNSLVMSDRNAQRLAEVAQRLIAKYPESNIDITTDNTQVINESDAVVSAVTTQFDLEASEWKHANIDGLFLIDDSQPGAFSPEQFESRNGFLTWVMGHDETEGGKITLSKFDYVGTGPASKDDIFGCQGEAAAVYLSGDYETAINTEVTPNQALMMDRLFKEVGISPAAFQRLGQYIHPRVKLVK